MGNEREIKREEIEIKYSKTRKNQPQAFNVFLPQVTTRRNIYAYF